MPKTISGSQGLISGIEGLMAGTEGLTSGMRGLINGLKGLMLGSQGLRSRTGGLMNGRESLMSRAKGLTVPSNTLMDEMMGLIAQKTGIINLPKLFVKPENGGSLLSLDNRINPMTEMESFANSYKEKQEEWSKNPDNWKMGVLYHNKEDKRIFPPKRYGIGWTVNFGNTTSVLVLVFLMILLPMLLVIGLPLVIQYMSQLK